VVIDLQALMGRSSATAGAMFNIQRGSTTICNGIQGAKHGRCPALQGARWSSHVHTLHTHPRTTCCQFCRCLCRNVLNTSKQSQPRGGENFQVAERLHCGPCCWKPTPTWSLPNLQGCISHGRPRHRHVKLTGFALIRSLIPLTEAGK
jgi:hypothetical protein